MNRKMLPLLMMLVAGTITSIATLIRDYTMVEKLFAVLMTLLIFYGLGSFMEYMLNSFEKQNEKIRLAQEAAAAALEQEQAAQQAESQG